MRGLIEPVARTHKLHGRQTSPGKRHAEYRRTFDVPAIAATEHRRRKAAGTLPYDLSEIWLRTLTID
ncbi:hypothetical protein KAW64_04880, partial [bacterium]|nr:hypothetical protein [bacterium]